MQNFFSRYERNRFHLWKDIANKTLHDRVVCVFQLEGTYWEAGAGTRRAAWEDRRGGNWPSCSASCSSCRCTPVLWPLCCWTAEALLSPWWAGATGSWPSSDCAKAWFGSVWLWRTHRGSRWVSKTACVAVLNKPRSIGCHSFLIMDDGALLIPNINAVARV